MRMKNFNLIVRTAFAWAITLVMTELRANSR